jgi:hypothetical protein
LPWAADAGAERSLCGPLRLSDAAALVHHRRRLGELGLELIVEHLSEQFDPGIEPGTIGDFVEQDSVHPDFATIVERGLELGAGAQLLALQQDIGIGVLDHDLSYR